MRLRHKHLRLQVPSLFQINKKGKKGGSDWCGRTSAAMICNYYYAARAGGLEAGVHDYIINQRERSPHDLVLPNMTVAVNGYELQGAIERVKPKTWTRKPMYPKAGRGNKPTEKQIRAILEPVLRALEMYNPVLFYTGLSSSQSEPRHIVVLSGYRVGPGGSLWLHINDPGSEFSVDGDGKGSLWTTAKHVTKGFKDREEVLIQKPPETDFDTPGRRYWLRASRLFDPNQRSSRTDDMWCDHQDSPGLECIYNNEVAEPLSECVETSASGAGLPVELKGPDMDSQSAVLAAAWANTGQSGAPYPLGTNRSWHNGIHFVHDEGGFESKNVLAIAPGEIVFARFPERTDPFPEDAGAVLVRHGFDPATLRLLDPRKDKEPPSSIVWLYSMYMHLAGGDEGIDALLAKVHPGEEPPFKEALPPPGACDLFGYGVGEEGATPVVPLGAPFEAGGPIDRASATATETTSGPRELLPSEDARTNLDAWEQGRPEPPRAPAGAAIGWHNPLTGEVIENSVVAENKEPPLEVAYDDAKGWHYVVAKEGEPTWIGRSASPAGFQLAGTEHCIHDVADRDGLAKLPENRAAVYLRQGNHATSVTSLGKKRSGSLVVKTAGPGELLLCDASAKQPALAAGAANNASAFPELIPCVSIGPKTTAKALADLAAGKPPRSQSGRTLHYYNPATQTILATNITLPGKVPLRHGDALEYTPDGSRVLIKDHEPEIAVARAYGCPHSRASIAELAALDDDAWPLLTFWQDQVDMFTETERGGNRRRFPDSSKITLSGPTLRFCVPAGREWTSNKWRAWPRLVPCAALEKKQHEAKLAELEATFGGPAAEALGRLMNGHSRLFGAQLTTDDCWVADGDAVVVREGWEGETLTLFADVVGKGRSRYFPDKPADGVNPVVELPLNADLKLRIVEQFKSGWGKTKIDRAIVEVGLGVEAGAFENNQAEIDAWKESSAFCERVRAELGKGDVVDFAAFEAADPLFAMPHNPFEHWRRTGHEPIAIMGHIDAERFGVHIEAFAGQTVVPSDGPSGLWREIRAKEGAQPLTKPFYEDIVAKILSDERLRALAQQNRDGTGTVGSALGGQPVPSGQWAEFCARPRVDRALSRIVAVHPTEWAMDWKELAKNGVVKDPGPEGFGPTAMWWPEGKLEGVKGEDLFFYHPLRLLEWLTTGIDARIELNSDKTSAMKLKIAEQEFEMAPGDGDEDGEVFRIRTVVGDRAVSTEGVLVLEGVDTTQPEVPMQINRGEILDLWLCEPNAVMEHQPRPTNIPHAVRVWHQDVLDQEDSGDVHLLADDNQRLADAGYSRATFEVQARYNVEMPTALEVSVKGKGMTIEHIELLGAKPLGKRTRFGGTAYELDLKPLGDPPEQLTIYRKVTARIDVVAHDKIDKSAKLEVSVSGGDLPKPVEMRHTIATRTIKGGAKGHDVAKIQHYLSQIHAGGKPCYAQRIDGDYGSGTARALWRFILHFCADGDWDRGLGRIASSKAARNLAPFTRPAASDLDEAAKDAYTAHGKPDVGLALIAELVRFYSMPHVLPALTLSVLEPDVDVALIPIVKRMSNRGLSQVFPDASLDVGASSVHVKVVLADRSVPGDPNSILASAQLSAETPFILPGPAKVGSLLSRGVRLGIKGNLEARSSHCTLKLISRGAVMGSLRLGGTRDLLANKSGTSSLDALQVQAWLAAYPDPKAPAHGFYTSDLDGKWQSGSSKSLKKFRDKIAPGESYVQLLARLKAGPEGAQEAAE